jgi:hypothetical protein
MSDKKNTHTEYDWVKYARDELYTIRKTTTVDIAKAYSQSEAVALIKQLEGNR